MEEYLTVEEVSKELRVSTDTIFKLLKQKKLVGYKILGVWRIKRDDLNRYLEQHKNINN